ncbi:hypothetical protein [Hymenobacter perfusus]|uniref:Uncharacterized protein n=1 Tax=Hymenobacter perfusus TaxID=1236770 RepID=A0A3R9MIH3_9BACT|nr:hypothetical protein [Hymenobacter perfusus]RSK46638.1 hypothetical protein EI293_05635 [Hymenobacter perfusus]
MPVSTTPARRARFFSRCPLVLLVLLMAAGCRSSQLAYQFRPAPVKQQLIVSEPPPDIATGGNSSEATVTAKPTDKLQPATQQRPKPRQVRQQMRQALAQFRTTPALKLRASQSAGQALRTTAGPRETTEVGLGTTVLGVLGLVVLPVALIGLLIWGGPVWAVLAGLAALAVLIAYLDPFG